MAWWVKLFEKDEAEKTIISPNGRIKCDFVLKNSRAFYRVIRDGKNIINKSCLDLDIVGEEPIHNRLKLIRSRTFKHQETVEMPWGEDRYIDNNYTECVFYLGETTKNHRIYTLRFRVFAHRRQLTNNLLIYVIK